MSAPKEIIELIDRFNRNRDAYRSGQYNETQLRREFLDPFFESLGWDIYNKQGYAEAYKDVIHEDAIKVGGATKAPDYCFRIGGTRKFFVEAKKPSVNLKEEISPAFQLRRYSWSAKLPLSILSDFEEFVVYDCRIKPIKTDIASTARIKYLTYTDYIQNWDELVSIFSRDAVLKGSFDKYVETTKAKKGTTEVDDAFLTEIELWRDMLARNIAIRNPQLTQRELNFAVQRTIDRLIFLRICEDRGIEEYGRLMALQNSERIYVRLCELFHRADERYNSGLFHFSKEKERAEKPDELTLNLALDDKPLKEIIKNLYYPDSPYEFSVLPADILGQVYEQFLGKVIRLTAGHHAVVEDKPEVKKAGGVYYTPTYIVDYIVKNTVGKLVENKTPKQVAKLRILDPACGSGSFLIGAYQLLLDWHRDWYVADGVEKHRKEIFQIPGGDFRLTTAERKRILLNNIYGVDIDPQAVEVTKLSLLLKVLEGENEQTITNQLRLFHERALPDLGNNIKCGNSLIGPDFYDNQQLSLLDEEEKYRINVFDWGKEFPEIFSHEDTKHTKKAKETGFDAVIGNPPYGAQLSPNQIDYLINKYTCAEYQIDTYPLFIEKAFYLSKQRGYCGLIIPSAWVASKYNEQFRKFLLNRTRLESVIIAPKITFINASVETLILIFNKTKAIDSQFLVERWDQSVKQSYYFNQKVILNQESYFFPVYSDPIKLKLLEKIRSFGVKLSEYVNAVWGVKIYQKGKGKPPQTGTESVTKCFHSKEKIKATHKPLLGGSEIKRYYVNWEGEYVDYGKWLAEPRNPEWFKGKRILVREVTHQGKIQATIVEDEYVFSNSVDCLKLKDEKYKIEYMLGILNSSLASFYHLNTSANAFKGAFPKVLIKDLLNIPLPGISFSNLKDKSRHDRMVELVDRMLTLHKQLTSAKTPDEKTILQRQIDATDHQIDQLVYELYGLTEEEINIIEK